MVEKIIRVPLRQVWKHEALDFTRWLQDNIDVLNEVIDIQIGNIDREQSAGSFSVDLLGEDQSGNAVIIENQLGKSDHDHLGKLITYTTAFDAKTAIWIVADARPEHIAAVTWLNESSETSFYLLKIEAIKIADSDPAPLLTNIVGPSEEGREVGKTKKELSERHKLRHEFWEQLLNKLKGKSKLFSSISPSHESWISAGAGFKSGVSYNILIWQDKGGIELYIDADRETGEMNFFILSELMKHKEDIENEFGSQLEWEFLQGKRATRLRKLYFEGGLTDQSSWIRLQDQLVDAIIKFEKVVSKHLKEIKM